MNDLVAAIARQEGIAVEHIVTGSGSGGSGTWAAGRASRPSEPARRAETVRRY